MEKLMNSCGKYEYSENYLNCLLNCSWLLQNLPSLKNMESDIN